MFPPIEIPGASDGPASTCPTVGDALREVLPLALFVPVAGPPAIFLVGPVLFLVVLLIPPLALLVTLAALLLVGAAVLFVIGALIASPYLLVRHIRGRQPGRRPGLALGHRPARPAPASSLIHLTPRQPDAKGTT